MTEHRRSPLHGLAVVVRRRRLALAVLTVVLTLLNRVVLHRVDLPTDLAYLLVGRLPAAGGTQEWPWESPWLVLPVAALVLFVALPRAWSWALVVVTFVLPHCYPYRIGAMELWGVRITSTEPTVLQLLHLPLLLLVVVLVVLVVDRPRSSTTDGGDAAPATGEHDDAGVPAGESVRPPSG